MIQVKQGHLYFDGCDTTQLAKEFGTPVYLVSKTGILNKIRKLKETFLTPYPKNRIAYAAKAFFPLGMAKLIQEEGICVDVVSGGELYTAIQAEFPPERIEFNGNNKSYQELELAIDYGIGRIIIDSLQELALIEEICKKKGRKIQVLYRITPGVKSDSHDYIVTGKKDSKFGIPLEDGIFFPCIEAALRSPYVELVGLHFHVGSQLLDPASHQQALEILLGLVERIQQQYDHEFAELNIGGGFGIRYTDETPPPFSTFLDPMMKRIAEFYQEKGRTLPAVVVEPGRSLVGENGMTLYTVGSIKEIPDIRTYVSVDGGMGDNIRPALYHAEYHGIVANKAEEPATQQVTISGKYCESGDILIKDLRIPPVVSGDLLAVLSTGAYGYAMASNYNKNPIPGVVLLQDGQADWMVYPQSYEDLLKNERVPLTMKGKVTP